MYYIAILAPEAINEQVLKWKHFMRDHFGCSVALKSPAHITLVSPFWMKTDQQLELEKSLTTFCQLQRNMLVEILNFDAFKPRVIFVDVVQSEELSSLASELQKHLSENPSFPLKQSTRPLHAHITIANRDLKKSDFADAWQHFSNKKYHASFQAKGITLLKHNGIQWDAAYTARFPFM